MNNPFKVIVFDAFGTLIKIGESRSPFRQLMKWLKGNGRKPSHRDAHIIMSNAVNIEQLALIFSKAIPIELLNQINNDLRFEIDTIKLYDDTIPVLLDLKELGFQIALCSNLAMPYGERLKQLFPNLFDAIIFSYEVAAIKPERQIYEAVQQRFNCKMSEMLFIGDHPILDVEIPINLGMSARLIDRQKPQQLSELLSDLLRNK